MKLIKKIIAAVTLVPALALAAEATFPLDRAPEAKGLASLQNGAKLFVNYCLNCHSASAMRYNRLRDIGLTDEQIQNNLLFTADKVGDLMKVSMSAKDGKEWFGATPPDLSVIARSKASGAGSGGDWLYTYLRTFYRDNTRPTGWNNAVFPNVGMPHVLWELQGAKRGAQIETIKEDKDGDKTVGFSKTKVVYGENGDRTETTEKLAGMNHHAGSHTVLGKASGGKLNSADYDRAVGDLVAYLNWMAEPAQDTRKRLGVIVLLFMSVLATMAWLLNKSYWKDVK